jgi:hypothetical protein
MKYRFTALISAAICATGAFGQNSVSTNSGPNGFSGSAHFGAPPAFAMRTVTGAPYSAEEVSEQVQTLGDGTHITQKSVPTKVSRDSLGRTRTERPLYRGMAMAGHVPDSPVIIEITDPVAQVKYTLDTINKVAHRQPLPATPDMANRTAVRNGVMATVVTGGGGGGAGSRALVADSTGQLLPSAAAPSEVTRPQTATENLGTQTVEGVLAEGTRRTTTWPVGAQGNDRPISMVSEIWMSPELKVMILSKSTDLRSGEHTQKLTNIGRGEPSSSLFQPPPEYTLVDETGEFTIKWGTQQ